MAGWRSILDGVVKEMNIQYIIIILLYLIIRFGIAHLILPAEVRIWIFNELFSAAGVNMKK